MKLRIISLIGLFAMLYFSTKAQTVNITPEYSSGTCSDYSVTFNGDASAVATSFNFNGGAVPAGWTTSPFTITSSICGAAFNTPDNSNYFWATDLGTTAPYVGKRFVQTNAVNVASGGTISFKLLYGNGNVAACEQPDLPTEEVWLQYSLDGSTWITIYDGWETSSSNAYAWYNWYSVNLAIPSGARTTSTRFRWYQASNSGDCCDNWGLEDVAIGTNISPTGYAWYVNGVSAGTTKNLAYTFPGAGTYTIKFDASFSDGNTRSSTMSYTVVENQAPTLNTISNVTVPMNSPTQTISLSGIGDGDCVAQGLTLSTASANTGIIPTPTYSYITPNSSGALYFTPSFDQVGTVSLSATITDDAANSYGSVKSITRNFSVYVNDYPTDPGNFTSPVGSKLNIADRYNIAWGVSTDQTAIVTYFLEYRRNTGSWTSISGSTDSSVSNWGGHMSSSFVGSTVQFRVRAYDGTYYSQYTTSPVFTIVDNTPPVANNDGTYNVNTGGTVTGNVLSNDTDEDGDDLDVTVQPTLTYGSFNSFNVETGDFEYLAPTDWVGSFSFQYTVTDGSDSDNATVTILVTDTIVPVVNTKNISSYLDASGASSIVIGDVNNGSTDNIGVGSLSLDITSFSCSDVGENTVTLSVSDTAGNSAEKTAIVTVIDNINPAVLTKDTTLYLNSDGFAVLTPESVDGGSNDNCSIDTMYLSQDTFDCGDVGVSAPPAVVGLKSATDIGPGSGIPVMLSVEDVNGNVGTDWFFVTVLDTISPTAICQDTTVYLDATGNVSVNTTYIDNGSNDACGIDIMTLDTFNFDCSNVGENTVVMTITDVNSNISTCSSTVTVIDTIAPVVSCMDTLLYLGETGMVTIDTSFVHVESNDACGIVSVTLSKSTFEGPNVGANMVIVSVTDVNGNIGTCTSTVTIKDTIAPEVWCQDIGVDLNADGNRNVFPVYVLDSTFDAGGIASYSLDIDRFDCGDVGKNPVVLTVTDFGGNVASCNSIIDIIDLTPPIVSCNDIEVSLNEEGVAEIDPSMIDNGSTDACGIAGMELSQSVFTGADFGNNSITLTVTDLNGNAATCEAKVTVKDEIAPVAACNPIDIWLTNSATYELTGADIEMLTAGSSDNALPAESLLIEITPSSFGCSNIGDSVAVEVSISDEAGNETTCSTNVFVNFTTDIQVDDIEIGLAAGVCETTVDYPEVFAAKPCAVFTQLEGLGADSIFPVGTTVETWELVYGGEKDTVSFSVIVTSENIVPTIDTIADVIANEGSAVSVSLSGISGGNDCIAQDVAISAVNTNTELVTGIEVGYTAGDTAGMLNITLSANESGTDTITVAVEDSEGATASRMFVLVVAPVNDAPVLLTQLEDVELMANDTVSISIATTLGSVFDDVDDTLLVYSVKMVEGGLPSWLSVFENEDAVVISLQPEQADTGCYNVVVEAMDAAGATATDTVEVCVLKLLTGIEGFSSPEFELSMYPNPSRGMVTLDLKTSFTGEAELYVLSISGQQVFHKTYLSSDRIEFDLSDKVGGSYLVVFQAEGKRTVKKLILDKK